MHHEGGMAQDILRKILKEAETKGMKKVRKARVLIGESLLAHPENVQMSFDMISVGTVAESAKLEIRSSKLRARCASCGKEYESAHSLSCPHCAGREIKIISGQELLVESVE